jgi:signal transduction histidine kinase
MRLILKTSEKFVRHWQNRPLTEFKTGPRGSRNAQLAPKRSLIPMVSLCHRLRVGVAMVLAASAIGSGASSMCTVAMRDDEISGTASVALAIPCVAPLSSAPMQRWRAQAEEQEQKVRREREARKRQEAQIMQERKAQSDAEWNAWLNAAIEAERKFMFDVHAQVIAEERKNYRAEIQRQVADAVRELRTEFNRRLGELRAELQDDGKVIDLPKGSWQRHVA